MTINGRILIRIFLEFGFPFFKCCSCHNSLFRNTTLCEVNQCVLESVLTLNIDSDIPPAKLLGAVKVLISTHTPHYESY